ncbi:MAG TPA: carboxypeptidase regulatory-like domain-containing protein, partial [Saprospiraceae bacterium]|nr:carboxypeptidase regulatory-like domain-containing protein [Saprospiraceae bacterium]
MTNRFPLSAALLLALVLVCGGSHPLFSQTQPIKVQVKNETAVNTTGLEFSPTFYEDGIVFISTNNAGLKKVTDAQLKLSAMSILRSRRNAEGLLQTPEPFAKELSSEYHEGPVCFDRTAETVYFSRNVLINGKVLTDKDGRQRMRLYSAKKSGSGWSDPVALPFNNNEFDDCHPAISIDGDKLYFSSNRPGGIGGMDLYVAYKVGESWSEPVNLGSNVNTTGNEVFPFVHADNTLYYASTGLQGKGGLDMYFTTPTGSNEWSKPQNLGEPFNTAGDDFGLIVDLDKINGYYSTAGAGGQGGDEIMSFYVENGNLDQYLRQNNAASEQYALKVVVVDKRSGAPIEDVSVRILSTEGGNVIGRDESGNLITITQENGQDVMKALPPDKGIEGITDYTGNFDTNLPEGKYAVTASKDGYQTKQATVTVSKPRRMIKIELDKGAVAGKARWNASLFNYVTNAPLSGAQVVLTDQQTGEKDTVYADANGMVDYYVKPNRKYKADIYQGGRIIGSADVDTQGWSTSGEPITQNFSVAPMMPGTAIQLPNIYYNFNDATLRPDARKDLNMVVALMRQQPSLTVELASHTDS